MRKIIILIPIFNDWKSLNKLLMEINESIRSFHDINFECLIVNDASTIQPQELNKPSNFESLEILFVIISPFSFADDFSDSS